jgi:hypothetical protein
MNTTTTVWQSTLHIPEILHMIMVLLPQTTLITSCRVCKEWCDCATRLLWGDLNEVGLHNLIKTLDHLTLSENEYVRR